ncbi:MAG: glycerophosphodiester phosphodiesterase [Rhodothermales bacterium]|nr:glycerophosphodiester phosphodiesterase [Rhodothermales bacterium]
MAAAQHKTYSFDLQGHRGARGLKPENTLPAFEKALELGVETLELDVVISGDGKVVVSHDPVMSTVICSHPDGTPVTDEVRLFDLTAEQIAAFDCGLRGNPRFPEQERMAVSKPLLSDVIRMEREVSAGLGRPPAKWNIETKSTREGDGVYHPGPDRFARLLYDVLRDEGILDRTVVQSFDPRTIQVVRALDPSVRLSLLMEFEHVAQPERALEGLGFVPEVYSPDHRALTTELVARIQGLGMEVLPWTVNNVDRMRELLEMGVEGLITDYPDRALPLRD